MAVPLPKTFAEVQEKAFRNFTPAGRSYFESGADDMQTVSENIQAFDRLLVRQKTVVLDGHTDSQHGEITDTSIDLFGRTISSPICVAPTGMKNMAHPDGEAGAAKAAFKFGTCLCVSTSYCVSSPTSIQELTEAAPDGLRWLQLYIYRDRSVTERVVRQAEEAGFEAIVLTVDAPIIGFRVAHVRIKDIPKSVLSREKDAPKPGQPPSNEYNMNFDSGAALISHVTKNYEPNLSWETVAWLRSKTKLPIILKGIMCYEDAIDCLKHDVQGIYVSNHGGRQLDCVPATIEVLPEVVRAVQGKIPVFVDGGIRRGSDVFKALALGVKAVFIGRPLSYGLAYNGTEGAHHVLEMLTKELKDTMVSTGCKKIQDINSSLIVHQSCYGAMETGCHYERNWTPDATDVLCLEDILHSARLKGYRGVASDIFSTYKRFLIRPRFLQGVTDVDTSVDLFGTTTIAAPLLISTSKCESQAMLDAVINVSRLLDLCVIVNGNDTKTLNSLRPQQKFMLYLKEFNNIDPTTKLCSVLEKANENGCIAVIIDAAIVDNALGPARKLIGGLPIIVKGVMGTCNTLACCKHDVQGIMVSEECLNGSGLYSLDRFAEMVGAVNHKLPVFLDGPMMRGTDMLKVLALGTQAVVIDHQLVWGFVHQGHEGMKKVLQILTDELRRAMMLSGCGSVKNITSSMVVRNDHYWKLVGKGVHSNTSSNL